MKKMISLIGAFGAVFGTAFAADAVVWPGEGTNAPAYWFSYTYPSDNSTLASIDTSTVDDVKIAKAKVTKGSKTSNGAGLGFGWQQDASYKDVPVSLAAYKGVCLTYRATAPFNIEFKQSGAAANFEMKLGASSVFKKKFVGFADLSNSKKTAWNATAQLQVQFSYKDDLATTTQNTNTIEISSIILADKCQTKPPKLKDGVEEIAAAELHEITPLDISLSEIFEDPDGDALVTVEILTGKSLLSLANPKESYSLDETVSLKSSLAGAGSAKVILTANDGENEVSYTLDIDVLDEENPPIAVKDSFTVKEDSVLVVKAGGILANDYDVDDPGKTGVYTITLVSSTEHGKLVLSTNKSENLDGGFTYTPDADYNGLDYFTYTITDAMDNVSKEATVVINVLAVNDPLKLKELDESYFKDTIKLVEDFDASKTDPYEVPSTAFVLDDVDGLENVIYGATSSGVVKVTHKFVAGSHYFEFSPIENANGVATITFWAKEGKDSVGVNFYVNVASVVDKPVAKDDSYKVLQDSLNKVGKPGVLSNDKDPENAKAVLKAYLLTDAVNGKVTLAEDGSFTYDAGSTKGEDSFTYFVVNEKGDTSNVATVTLTVLYKNKAPQVVEGVADTVGNRLSKLTEDFTSRKTFARHEVFTWFKDDSTAAVAMTYTVRSDDSLLAPAFQSGGALIVDAVKNACGDAEIIVTATDGKKASTELVIPASIACVNDKPELLKKSDTVYVGTKPVWKDTFDLASLFKDVDGDTLKYEVTAEQKSDDYIKWTVKGSKLIVSSKDSASLAAGSIVFVNVKASDAETAISTKIAIYAAKAPTTGIAPVIAMPKATWQNAIRANRGAVALFDMQGRVMWKAKLPVSEADVRNAAAQVQGRKILRVNKQTWTIK